MGYTTEFEGSFSIQPTLKDEHQAYLNKFAETRRMRRDARMVSGLEDKVREAAGLPVGEEGCYYVGAPGMYGQGEAADILDYNNPPQGQPGLWCQWVPDEMGEELIWDGSEKFYNYTEWLKYLIEHFLAPWGYRLDGRVAWQGEEASDIGALVVDNNAVTVLEGKITFESPEGSKNDFNFSIEPSWTEEEVRQVLCSFFPNHPLVRDAFINELKELRR